MLAAIAPALIYYAYLMFSVHLRAISLDLDARDSDILESTQSLGQAARAQWHLAVSIAVLVWLLVTGMPAGSAAMIAVLLLLGLDMVVTVTRGRFSRDAIREAVARVVNGLAEGARAGAMVATVIAVIGVLIELLTVTDRKSAV